MQVKQKLFVISAIFILIISSLTISNAMDNPYSGGWTNCTWSAWQLVKENAGIELPNWGDAGNWYYGAANDSRYQVGQTPAKNSVICYSNHVAYVTDVLGNNKVYIKEGGFKYDDGSLGKHEGASNATGSREYTNQPILGYIYLDSVSIDYAYVEPRSMNGNSYKLVVEPSSKAGINRVIVRTWTETKADSQGRTNDDLVEQRAKLNSSNGHYEVTIKKSEHNYESGLYRSEIYVYDNNNNVAHKILEPVSINSVYAYPKAFEGRIVLKTNKKYVLGINSNRDVVLKKKNTSDDSQIWKFTRGNSGDFKITNKSTGLVMDVERLQDVQGARIQVYNSNDQVNQRFYLTKYNGGYRISARVSSDMKGLDVPNLNLTDGNAIKLGRTNSIANKAQTFVFEEVSDKVVSMGSSKVFPDVEKGKWYEDAVKYVKEQGLMSGYGKTTDSEHIAGNFGPENTITRAEIASILYRYAGSPEVEGTTELIDIKNNTNAWYYKAVLWCNQNGIINGYGSGVNKGKFLPNNEVIRQDLAVMLEAYARILGGENTETTQSLSSFSDSNTVSNYAMKAMKWVVNKGIITGSNGKLLPHKTATRAETASMIMRFCENV